MSGHRRVKDIDYDADNIYSEEEDEYAEGEGDGYTDSDRAQLAALTPVVRAELEEAGMQADDIQIEESLYHYYYDVGKTVAYLKNSRTPREQGKKPKAKSKFDEAAEAARAKTGGSLYFFALERDEVGDLRRLSAAVCPRETVRMPPISAQDFFAGVPRSGVSGYVEGRLVPVHALNPRHGLLGGSSKLAKLAEERRKKAAAAQSAPAEANGAASLLDKLGKKPVKGEQKENEPPKQKTYPIRRRRSPTPPPKEPEPAEAPPEPAAPDLRASPSSFGKTITRASHGSAEQERMSLQDIIRMGPDSAVFQEPSPDDIVQKAQSQGKATQPAKQPNTADSTTNKLSQTSLGPSSPAAAPKSRSKGLDVPSLYHESRANFKPSASFVVVGHVDHGKSTLMGRLLLDTGAIPQRTIDRYQKEAKEIGKSSFALAWVMDTGSEERERGVTVDIAQHYFSTESAEFTILDAPGHRDFVPSMISGASMAEFAVLVVDAAQLESGMKGQTREHVLLVKALGIERVVVAVNKMDTTHPPWSEASYEDVKQQMLSFLHTVGFKDDQVSFVPVSGLSGGNVVSRLPQSSPGSAWMGPSRRTLIQELERSTPEPVSEAIVEKPLRMQVSDVFRGGVQHPLSVAGRLGQGSAQVGESVVVMPANESGTIRAIEVNGNAADWAVAGQIVTLHLQDMDPSHLRSGDVLCSAKKPLRNISSFTLSIMAYEHILPGPVDVHCGRLHVPGKVAQIMAEAGKKRPRVLQPGSRGTVKVELEAAVPLEGGERVVLRMAGKTAGAGVIGQGVA